MNFIRKISHKQYLLILAGIFSIEFILLAINPHDRGDWLLENVLVFVFVIAIWLSFRKLPMSRVSYTLIFIFLMIHEIGAHYTYAQVPYDAWLTSIFLVQGSMKS